MRLSIKMIIVFSTIIILAILLLSQYAIETVTTGADSYTQMRINNMGGTITRDMVRELDTMALTINELTENSSFLAAINTYVRDDSDDNKVGIAAKNAAMQHLYQSPLVDEYYRVSFFTLDGHYISSRPEKDSMLINSTDNFKYILRSLPYLKSIDEITAPRVIAPCNDTLSNRSDIYVYGLVQPVRYHGNIIGYLAVYNETSQLSRLLNYVDNLMEIEIEVSLSNGNTIYTNSNADIDFTPGIPTDSYTEWTDATTGIHYDLMHTEIDAYGIEIYIARNASFRENGNRMLTYGILERAAVIAVPAVALISIVSMLLANSIYKLTRKVKEMSVERILKTDTVLTDHVTSHRDRETYMLESAYNNLMQSLRNSVNSELSLREGTLQAQLNALQTQINPHFIYNTLNIISAKSMESGNFDVIELCDQFASMLRYSTDTRSRTATVQQEIENVSDYLKIAKARFENNLEYSISVPQNIGTVKMPKLSLQPLVENALNHGYDGTNLLRKIDVTGRIEGKNLLLCIHDNGTGFEPGILRMLRAKIKDMYDSATPAPEATEHIGLLNTVMRLYYYSNGKVRFDIGNDGGAYIVLTIPLNM